MATVFWNGDGDAAIIFFSGGSLQVDKAGTEVSYEQALALVAENDRVSKLPAEEE